MAKAQRNQEEEQYAKDVTRMEQQTEVHSHNDAAKYPISIVEQQREICYNLMKRFQWTSQNIQYLKKSPPDENESMLIACT